MSYDGLNEIKLENIEYGILLERTNVTTTRVLKLNIPKLMPLANSNNKEDGSITLNRGILLNDTSSIPTPPKKIQYGNFISVPVSNSAWRAGFWKPAGTCKCYRVDGVCHHTCACEAGEVILEKGTKILCLVPNGNIKDIRATDLY